MKAADLGRRSPPAAWEAYFLIAIFPGEGDLRWCKVHAFSGGRRPAHWCLSAVEGMNGAGEELVLLGRAGGVERHARPLVEFDRSPERWDLSTPTLRWRGAFPELALDLDAPRVRAITRTPRVAWWSRVPGVLSYWSAMGEVTWNGLRGVALVEHAWGAASPIDLSPVLPRAWQWDVVAREGDDVAAGLSVGVLGRMRPIPGGGARGLAVRERRPGERWRASLLSDEGRLDYEAQASTPVAAMFTGGGFVGFRWEGEWRPRAGPCRPARGEGFSEFRGG